MNGLGYEKSKRIAIRVVRLSKYLRGTKREYVMSKQVLRSGTSIGANLAEAKCAISRAEFLSKIYIALKETMETLYWLELLYETDYLTYDQYASIRGDVEEMEDSFSDNKDHAGWMIVKRSCRSQADFISTLVPN